MFKHAKWVALLVGILLILAGLFVLNNPLETLAGMGWLFAVAMIANGLTDVFAYFGLPKEARSFWLLVGGIITSLLGFWLLFQGPLDWAVIIPIYFGVWMLFSGISRLIDTFLVARTGLLGGGINFILIFFAIIGAIFGVILFTNPGLAATTAILLLAGSLIYQGIMNIIFFFRLR